MKFYETINKSIETLFNLKDEKNNKDKFILLVHQERFNEIKKAVKYIDNIKYNLKVKKNIPVNLLKFLLYYFKCFAYFLLDKMGLEL